MEFPIKFGTVKSGWSIVCMEGVIRYNLKNIYEPQSLKTSLNDEVIKMKLITHLIFEVLGSYPEIS